LFVENGFQGMRMGGTVFDFLPFVIMFRDIHHVRRLLSESLPAFLFFAEYQIIKSAHGTLANTV